MAERMFIKKNDTVVVISGKDKGKKGKVLKTEPSTGKIIIEGVNMATKHKKARNQGDKGGIIHVENPIFAAKAMLFCGKCNKPTRRAYKMNEDGSKVRVCKHCGETFDR